MSPTRSAIGLLALGLVFLRAEGPEFPDRPVFSRPSLGQAFPFLKKEDGVHVAQPLLLNGLFILPPNAVLRTVYPRPTSPQWRGPGGLPSRPHGKMTQAGGPGGGPPMEFAPGDLPSPDLAKMMEELRQTIWKDPALFVEALNQIGPQNPQLLFTLPGNPNLQEEAIELPEGLLLAEQEHGPVVLAVLRESTSDKAGLHPGDQLSLINETIPVPTLEDWRTQYPKAKAAAKLSSRAWTVQILRPGETKTQTLSFKPPTNLSGVMDLPVE